MMLANEITLNSEPELIGSDCLAVTTAIDVGNIKRYFLLFSLFMLGVENFGSN